MPASAQAYARYQARCVEPAPVEVRSVDEGGCAPWWDLGEWLVAHLDQDELFDIYCGLMSEVDRTSTISEEAVRRATEVLLIAFNDETCDRADRVS